MLYRSSIMSITLFIMAVVIMPAVADKTCAADLARPDRCATHCAARVKRNPKDVLGTKESVVLKTKDVLMKKKEACVGPIEECCCAEGQAADACDDTLTNWCRCNGMEDELFPARFTRVCEGPSWNDRYEGDNFCNTERDEANMAHVEGQCHGWSCCFNQGCTDEEFAIHCPTEMTLTPCPTIEPGPTTTLGPLYDAQGRFIGAVERALRFGRRSINQSEGFTTESPYAKRDRFTGEAGRALRFGLRRSANKL